MRLVIQRVSKAAVHIGGVCAGAVGSGLLILAGIEEADTEEDVRWLANKAAAMRIFSDADGKMNLSVREVSGSVLVVSQFTLHASTRKGTGPLSSAPRGLSGPFPCMSCLRRNWRLCWKAGWKAANSERICRFP